MFLNKGNLSLFGIIKNSVIKFLGPILADKSIKKCGQNIKYDVILFLSYHETFKKIFKNIVSYKNKVLDPFNYYS